MAFWNRRRSIDAMLAPHDGPRLKPTLSWPHLLALGVGAIVGTGILTLSEPLIERCVEVGTDFIGVAVDTLLIGNAMRSAAAARKSD